MDNVELPALAQYKSLLNWTPEYGDFIIYSGWFSSSCGFIIDYDGESELSVIWSGVPYILLTLTPEEQKQAVKKISLTKIQSATTGTYAVQQSDKSTKEKVWFI